MSDVVLQFTNCRGEPRSKTVPHWVCARYFRRSRRLYLAAVAAGHAPRYRACSGQGSGPRQWGVCDELSPSWRLSGRSGHIRLFATHDAAKRAADAMNRESANG